MWDICGRDKKVKLEMNDRRKEERCVSGTLYLGTSRLNDMPMGRERAAPFISNFKLISPGLLLRSNIPLVLHYLFASWLCAYLLATSPFMWFRVSSRQEGTDTCVCIILLYPYCKYSYYIRS